MTDQDLERQVDREQMRNSSVLADVDSHDGESAAAPLFSIGSIVLEKYQVVKLLGVGGMGSVYQVRNLHSHVEYALKYLDSQHTTNTVWRRFDNEARAAGKLDHPNLVKVHDFGLLPDGQPYFVMDLVRGVTLADELKSKTRLPLERTLKIMIQVAFAMAYAHDHGVVHRDIKPSNIMLASEQEIFAGNVKLVDFGIAKLTGQDTYNQMTLTRTGEIFGSPLYMSPEQCAGIATDHRSDLYSFGCVMYEALTGAPPILGDSALSTMSKHQNERPVSLKEASLGITFPAASELIIAKLLEKDPQRRYQSAHELLSDLVSLEQHLVAGASAPNVVARDVQKQNALPPVAQSKWYRISVPMAVLLLAAGFFTGLFVGFYVQPEKSKAVSVSQNLPIANGGVIELKKADTFAQQPHETLFDERVKSFSQTGGLSRLFVFPSESIGQISMEEGPVVDAKVGEHFENFLPLKLNASQYLYQHPKLILKFRPDELAVVNLNDCDQNLDELLQGLTTQKFLQTLKLANSSVTESSLPIIGKMKSLTRLDLTGSRLTGANLVQMKNLLNLENLTLTQVSDAKTLLQTLKKSHNLKLLALTRTVLDVDDLNTISKIKTIRELDLTGDSVLNDRTIAVLQNLPNLHGLDIEACNITAASIPVYKKMHRLIKLHITGDNWSDQEKQRLQSELGPKCEIDWRGPRSTINEIGKVLTD